MYRQFTDRARQVMQLAEEEARLLRRGLLGAEHILLGMIAEGDGVAGHVLKQSGIDLKSARSGVRELDPSLPDEHVNPGTLPLTREANLVIEAAHVECKSLKHNYIGTEHLLLGLCRQQEGLAVDVLTGLGVNLDEIHGDVLSLLGHEPSIKCGMADSPETSTIDRPATKTADLPELTADERERYEWQLSVRDFGEQGQRRLKKATVLISRIGGVGGTVAMQLAAAGVGRLVLAHAGNLRLNDLNRQLLMTTDWIGKPRVDSAARRLRELNPLVVVDTLAENVSESNIADLVGRCDVVVSAAPLFTERLLMNAEAVGQRKPLVDCAMYDLEGRLSTVIPGRSFCLNCLYPEPPPNWKREFPVFSAVASTVGALAAMEVLKLIAGVGEPLAGNLLCFDLREMSFRKIPVARRPDCAVCGHL